MAKRKGTNVPHPITLEAERLEALLQAAVSDEGVGDEWCAVLYAAALEVAELEHILACGRADLILWATHG